MMDKIGPVKGTGMDYVYPLFCILYTIPFLILRNLSHQIKY